MSAMHIPGLDTFLTVPDERRRRFRCPEDAVAELSAELLATSPVSPGHDQQHREPN